MLIPVAPCAPGCERRNFQRLRFVTVTCSSVVYCEYSFVVSHYNLGIETSNSHAGGVQSVDRAISVLEILAQRGEAGVSEVAAEIDVHKSTAFRLLGALEARGLVEQAGERGKYRLGFGIVRLAGAVTGRIDITQQGRPVCESLAEELGETVNIAVLQEHYAVNLYQVRGPGAVTAQNWVGQLTPLHATSSGKILLAYLPAKERAAVLAESGLKKVTQRTITAKTKLEKNLVDVRESGYAWALEELELGLHAMAAPIRNRDGEVVAALSASGPAYRLTKERLHELAPVLIKGAEEISHRMGYLG
ncbi:IclR family transcriptional regulator [Streptomyces montanus]|uniref:Glycerol operon regulatory protein n=1 Tax=Streptomyces montanus TaxID=2580423 RepID=A0A5R9FPW8_9ACTN|nr:IclR family transcriptional regulator [Streptomyces montanus]